MLVTKVCVCKCTQLSAYLHTLRRTISITLPIIDLKLEINCIPNDSMKTGNTNRFSACMYAFVQACVCVCVCAWASKYKTFNNKSGNKSNNSWGISRVFQHIWHLQGRFTSVRRSEGSAPFPVLWRLPPSGDEWKWSTETRKSPLDGAFMCFIAPLFVAFYVIFCPVTTLLLLVFIVVVCALCVCVCYFRHRHFTYIYFGRVCDGAIQIMVEKHLTQFSCGSSEGKHEKWKSCFAE